MTGTGRDIPGTSSRGNANERMPGWLVCPECRRMVPVTRQGLIRKHQPPRHPSFAGDLSRCPASGTEPQR